jgi:hypothetical protein
MGFGRTRTDGLTEERGADATSAEGWPAGRARWPSDRPRSQRFNVRELRSLSLRTVRWGGNV